MLRDSMRLQSNTDMKKQQHACLTSPGYNHFWILDDVTIMDVAVGSRGNSFIIIIILYSSPGDFVPYLCPMKPCKITEDNQLHTTSKELMMVAMTRQKNSDEKSGGGPCCEGLDRGITSL